MRSRAIVVAAVLSSALVSGGWLIEHDAGARAPLDANAGARLFDEVLAHVRRDYVDTLADTLIYRKAVSGMLGELHDPHSLFLDQRRLSRLDESTSGHPSRQFPTRRRRTRVSSRRRRRAMPSPTSATSTRRPRR